jgi:hypothetical protein
VAATNAYTRTTRTVSYETNSYSDAPTRRETISTDVYQAILLVDAGGRQRSFTLRNFGTQIFGGQVVSVCWAVRGRRAVTFATLNHSAPADD